MMTAAQVELGAEKRGGGCRRREMKFVVRRDGTLQMCRFERFARQGAARQASQRALSHPKQLEALHPEFTEPQLTVYLS